MYVLCFCDTNLVDTMKTALRWKMRYGSRAFAKKSPPAELRIALGEIESDIPAARHWAECRRLSRTHTEASGFRAFDIFHVAGALLSKADTFATFDDKQCALAKAVGLLIVPVSG